MINLEKLRLIRNHLFSFLGNSRIKRIIVITLFISLIWIMADVISNSYDPNYWHDLICIILAVFIERMLPWGKQY